MSGDIGRRRLDLGVRSIFPPSQILMHCRRPCIGSKLLEMLNERLHVAIASPNHRQSWFTHHDQSLARGHLRRPFSKLLLLLIGLAGCFSDASGPDGPGYDPPTATQKAFAELDANQDGFLENAEFIATPGLAACLPTIDSDGDGKLSRGELEARLQGYLDEDRPYTDFTCEVFYLGQPLEGGKVRLVPESFLADGLSIVEGTIDAAGMCLIPSGAQAIPGVYSGMYRIEVSSNQVSIPEKYNTQTELGVEVSPTALARRRSGFFHIEIRR